MDAVTTKQDVIRARVGEAVNALTSVCDGATSVDGQGYNKVDAWLGRKLSAIPVAQWTDQQLYVAYSTLHKYKRQLEGMGIDYDSIPAPAQIGYSNWKSLFPEYSRPVQPSQRPVRVVKPFVITPSLNKDNLRVEFEYDTALKDAVKATPGARYSAYPTPAWIVPYTFASATALAKVVERFVVVPEEYEAAMAVLRAVAEETNGQPERYPMSMSVMENGHVKLKFDKSDQLLNWRRELLPRIEFVDLNPEGGPRDPDKIWWDVAPSAENCDGLAQFAGRVGYPIPARVAGLLLETIERSARNMAGSVAMDSDFHVDGLALELYPFQRAGVAFTARNHRVLVADQMGCIDGDAEVSVHRAGATRRMPLSKLFYKFNGGISHGRTWDPSVPAYIKSLGADGILALNQVVAVLDKGSCPVVRVTLASGKTIRLTPDHEVAVEGGWQEAGQLRAGDAVLTNGLAICSSCGADANVTTYKYAKFPGVCRRCMYRKYRHNSKFKTGRSIDGDGYVRVSGHYDHPRANNGTWVYEHILVMEQHLGRPVERSEQVHHKNGKRWDNRIENLEMLTAAQHLAAHRAFLHMDGGKAGRGGDIVFVPKKDRVVSVEPDGVANVYDVVMADPARNFVAGGVIVHNCGKTITTLATAVATDAFPVLVVCPATLKYNWLEEIRKWIPALVDGTLVVSGTKLLPSYDGKIVICNYDVLKYHLDGLVKRGFRTLIADESHMIKDPKAQRSKAVATAAKWPTLVNVLLATGTPVLNGRSGELINMLEILGVMDEFGGKGKFLWRYCGPKQIWNGKRDIWTFTGATNTEELSTKLAQTCMLRRLTKDVLPELPPVQRIKTPIELSKEAKDEYQDEMRRFYNTIKECKENDEDLPDGFYITHIGACRRIVGRGKLHGAKEWIDNYMEQMNGDGKLIVYAHHIEVEEELLRMYPDFLRIMSDMKDYERMAQVNRFQSDKSVRGMVIGLMTGGVGLTLTECHHMLFIEHGWRPGDMSQAESRAFGRLNDPHGLSSYWTFAPGTIDEYIVNLLEKKEAINAILHDSHRGDTDTRDLERELIKMLRKEARAFASAERAKAKKGGK